MSLGNHENGNYLGILELLEYDAFLYDHLKRYGNPGSGHVFYFSSMICDEFVHLIGDSILRYIIREIKENKYSISVDSTPDISKTDQLTFIIRYVKGDTVLERFLEFRSSSHRILIGSSDFEFS
eukprot:Pompholyxophrys_punicea_v1_NODE_454_length_1917_cov_181.552872.p1 type:complete len:124 gc:universal NODE_454_length_1917_cov_181.552872:1312-941(-)